jgi:hypothetical protein
LLFGLTAAGLLGLTAFLLFAGAVFGLAAHVFLTVLFLRLAALIFHRFTLTGGLFLSLTLHGLTLLLLRHRLTLLRSSSLVTGLAIRSGLLLG